MHFCREFGHVSGFNFDIYFGIYVSWETRALLVKENVMCRSLDGGWYSCLVNMNPDDV